MNSWSIESYVILSQTADLKHWLELSEHAYEEDDSEVSIRPTKEL